MASQFGRGFITNLVLICKHFSQKPEEAFFGAADHLTDLVLPDQFRGTEVEELVTALRKRIIWHQPGTMDREDAEEVVKVLNKLIIAIDRRLGIKDPEIGEFQ
jgi:hypothetical protein